MVLPADGLSKVCSGGVWALILAAADLLGRLRCAHRHPDLSCVSGKASANTIKPSSQV